MNNYSVFFSIHGKGWYRVIVPTSLRDCSYESLVNWAAMQVSQQNLKGFFVSENPRPPVITA